MVGWTYDAPFDELPPGASGDHRVIPWSEITQDHGTGIVHIAPGDGREDLDRSKGHELPALTPVDEAGRFHRDYGWLAGRSTTEAAEPIIDFLRKHGEPSVI